MLLLDAARNTIDYNLYQQISDWLLLTNALAYFGAESVTEINVLWDWDLFVILIVYDNVIVEGILEFKFFVKFLFLIKF